MSKLVAVVPAFLLLLAGCSALDIAAEARHVNSCASDLDCQGDNGRCDLALGACVSAGAPPLEKVVLHVTDPLLGTTMEQEVELPEDGSEEPLDIRLAEPLLVRGTVAHEGADGVVLAARLTFRRRSTITHLLEEAVFVEAESRAIVDDSGEVYNYQVRLPAGEYEVDVEPPTVGDDEPSVQSQHPLFFEATLEEPAGGGETVRLDVQFPVETRRISSVVVDAEGTPLAGVRVYAFDEVTGRRVSSVAVTGCDQPGDESCGRFEIALSTERDTFRLRLSGTETQPMLPEVEFGVFTFSEFDTAEPLGRLTVDELGELAFPALEEPILYQTVVEGVDRSGAISPLVGATLHFSSVVTPEHRPSDGLFELSATTDESGAVVAVDEGRQGPDGRGIWLHPGEYDVTIVPPPDGQLATGTSRVAVVAPEDGEEPAFERLTVGARLLLSGVVTSPDGQPVAQSTVEAVGEGGVTFSAVTGADGAYELFADGGFYEVRFIPPERSMLSWARRLQVAVFGDLELDATVGWGTPFEGNVVDAVTGEPVESALFEAFHLEQIPDGDPVLVPFARLRTSIDGGFVFIVPQDPAPE